MYESICVNFSWFFVFLSRKNVEKSSVSSTRFFPSDIGFSFLLMVILLTMLNNFLVSLLLSFIFLVNDCFVIYQQFVIDVSFSIIYLQLIFRLPVFPGSFPVPHHFFLLYYVFIKPQFLCLSVTLMVLDDATLSSVSCKSLSNLLYA